MVITTRRISQGLIQHIHGLDVAAAQAVISGTGSAQPDDVLGAAPPGRVLEPLRKCAELPKVLHQARLPLPSPLRRQPQFKHHNFNWEVKDWTDQRDFRENLSVCLKGPIALAGGRRSQQLAGPPSPIL